MKNLILYGDLPTSILVKRGLKVGKNFSRMDRTIIDSSHCELIEIGDDVTMAPRSYILAHDASMKRHIGYTKISKVKIGSRVFIGAGSMIMPGVTIGDDVIVGASSVVTKSVPNGKIVAGNPATIIGDTNKYIERLKESEEFINRNDVDDFLSSNEISSFII